LCEWNPKRRGSLISVGPRHPRSADFTMQSMALTKDLAEKLAELTRPVADLDESLLASAIYDGDLRLAVLKFYDQKAARFWLWRDNTGHKPYCYTRLGMEELVEIKARKDVIEISEEEKLDLLNDTRVTLRKIITTDPLAIGGGNDSIRDRVKAWEADIKYYENYAYDRGLKMGTYYRVTKGKVVPVEHPVPERVGRSLDDILKRNSPEFAPYLKEWAQLLGEPLCEFKRVALDIEVANEASRLPDPEDPKQPVIAVSFFNEDEQTVYVLRSGKDSGGLAEKKYRVMVFEDETELLRAVMSKILDYPVVVTFNGDDFDLRYLKHRAEKLGIGEEENPIQLERVAASLKHGVHIDLYQFFRNRSIQVYAFSNKYTEHTLNGIAEALLNKSKIEFEGEIGDLPLAELAGYCLNDSQLTYELTSMGGSVVMKLLLVISRIGKMPINDVSRLGVSNWIRSMLFFEHRKMGALIPRQDELAEKGGASSQAIIKGKKYKGGLVIEPKPGVFFDVSVLDFASLYPSLIKVHNLSYETVDCPHEECRSNTVPDTSSWVCTKRKGITSLVTGSLRDLRVSHYKPLTKDPTLSGEDRELYNVVTQGLKVFLNAIYGSMGFETFAFYCLPVAEATAALGRDAITKTIQKCGELGINVLYSDTDSIFLQDPSTEQVSAIERWANGELGVELDLDKTYRYVAFSSRKKNYFGVLPDGTADIKGLTGKKSQTPEYLKETFYTALDILSQVKTESDFEKGRADTKALLTKMIGQLKKKEVPVEKLAFNVMMGKPTEKYNGTTPQHVRAAKLLEERGREIKAGEIIAYVKTKNPPYVKPVELARVDEIDADKYIEYAHSMFDQILDALDFSFDEIMGATTLDFFWSS
jgi:DNA polymerase I